MKTLFYRHLAIGLVFLLAFGVSAQEGRVLKYPNRPAGSPPPPQGQKPGYVPELFPAPTSAPPSTPPSTPSVDKNESQPKRRVLNKPEIQRGPAVQRDAVAQEATAAATQLARQIVGEEGSRQYYQVGLHEGWRRALAQGRDDWSWRTGKRLGLGDPDSLARGTEMGSAEAAEAARRAAWEQVTREYEDLSREPRRNPIAVGIPQPEPFLGRENLTPPTLDQVIQELPLSGFSKGRGDRNFNRQGFAPRSDRFWLAERYSEFFDGRWREPQFAFSQYCDDQRQSRFYRGLRTNAEREGFEQTFYSVYADSINSYYQTTLRRAYEVGFNDGFDYGCEVNAQWQFRQGYYEGARQSLAESADAAFQRYFSHDYRRFYDDYFDEWRFNAKPKILDWHVTDANSDSVFEPGEPITVEVTLANYGGAPGAAAVVVGGPVDFSPNRVDFDLPARGRLTKRTAFAGRIPNSMVAYELFRIWLEQGENRVETEIRVSYPLQFAGQARVSRLDRIGGVISLAVGVANISSKPYPAAKLVCGGTIQPVPPLKPGEESWIGFEFSGLNSLALIGGQVWLDFEIHSRGLTLDRHRHGIPEVATDLSNQDLMRVVLELAQRGHATRADRQLTFELLESRFLADWRAAINQSGNPYKQGRRGRSSETALGEFVETYIAFKHRMADPTIFTEMGTRLLDMSKDLPGTHPFLRREFRKLASQLR